MAYPRSWKIETSGGCVARPRGFLLLYETLPQARAGSGELLPDTRHRNRK